MVAAGGALWYAAMSLLSSWVYEPSRVSPRDLGLSSSAILTQASVGLAVSVSLGVVLVAVAVSLAMALFMRRDPEIRELIEQMPLPLVSDDPISNAAAVARLEGEGVAKEYAEQLVRALHDERTADLAKELSGTLSSGSVDSADDESLSVAAALNTHMPRAMLRIQAAWMGLVMGAYAGVVIGALVGLVVVAVVASDSRQAIQSGRAPSFIFGLASPWTATIAKVTPAPGSAKSDTSRLPTCALFLGQSESTVFLREPSGPTIRIPASSVRLDLLATNECP